MFFFFLLIFSVFTLKNCEDLNTDYIEVRVTIHRNPPADSIVIQFNKNEKIDPILLRVNETNFQLLEDKNHKMFQNIKPIRQNIHETIPIYMEYRQIDNSEQGSKLFRYEIREPVDEDVFVRFLVTISDSPTSESIGGVDRDIVPMKPVTDERTENPIPTFKEFNTADLEDSSCENMENFADELLNTALSHSTLGRLLLIKGYKETATNPVDAVREIIVDKLELPQLEYRILQAKFIDVGLLFEMQTPIDNLQILTQSRLNNTQKDGLKIEPTRRNFFDNTLDIRSA